MEEKMNEQFKRAINDLPDVLTLTPVTQAFFRTIQQRVNGVETGGIGVTVETLTIDLVSILSEFETRISSIEDRAKTI